MKFIKEISLACLLGSTSFTLQAKTQAIPEEWKNECVGYFQISVPGEVEIGVVQDGPDPSKGTHNLQNAGNHFFADPIYLEGSIRTSSSLPKSSFSRIKDETAKLIDKLKKGVGSTSPVEVLEYEADQNSTAYSFISEHRATAEAFIYQGGANLFRSSVRRRAANCRSRSYS